MRVDEASDGICNGGSGGWAGGMFGWDRGGRVFVWVWVGINGYM